MILDDDVILCKNIFDTVIKSFERNLSADFISFKILDLEGNDYKSYPKEKQWHTLRTLTGIGTTEMAFKSDLILKNNISFDESFGPGSDIYPIGEDFIFAMDLYKMKTKMLFLPIPIVKHPRDSTGGSLDQKVIFGRGAMFARVFGWKAFVVNILFSIKKYTSYRKKISFFSYLTSSYKRDYRLFHLCHKESIMKELVSIIMPNYNSASFIEESIVSVLSQTYENWELIVVDDCSSDDSLKVIESLIADDKRIKLIKLSTK